MEDDIRTTIEIDCIGCAHLGEGTSCDAFPNGIPQDILDGLVSHRVPYQGDNGIQYKPDMQEVKSKIASLKESLR